jgi:hypothetical protein
MSIAVVLAIILHISSNAVIKKITIKATPHDHRL